MKVNANSVCAFIIIMKRRVSLDECVWLVIGVVFSRYLKSFIQACTASFLLRQNDRRCLSVWELCFTDTRKIVTQVWKDMMTVFSLVLSEAGLYICSNLVFV